MNTRKPVGLIGPTIIVALIVLIAAYFIPELKLMMLVGLVECCVGLIIFMVVEMFL